jgi:CRISPR-associated endonuclease Csn1
MKRILGLDLGTASIGWALVEEAENENEISEIVKLGVRVNPLSIDEKTNFEKGRPLTTNADRTLKRGARRNLQRFKLRRENLLAVLKDNGILNGNESLTEDGKNTTHQLVQLRALSAREKVELDDFARILLAINKKRGYKSSRKTKIEGDGVAIDGMAVAKFLYEEELTPGQYVWKLLTEDKKFIPDFYRSDLNQEFDTIWNKQLTYYPTLLTMKLYDELQGKNKSQTWAICQDPFKLVGIKLSGGVAEQKRRRYELRVEALSHKLDLENLAIVLQEVNNDQKKSSGYLGAISDRSKILFTEKKTVGEYLYGQIKVNHHTSLKNQVFYRQDYLDEFEQIWDTQAKYHKELTPALKAEIRDIVIFYQRKLKSQKGLLSFCLFESWQLERVDKNGDIILNKLTGKPKLRTVGQRVVPKSSPLFQEFKIWQNINDLEFGQKNMKDGDDFLLDEDQKQELFEELNIGRAFTEKQLLKFFGLSDKEWTTNQPVLDGKKNVKKPLESNRTNAALLNVFQEIAVAEGYGFDWAQKTGKEIREELKAILPQIGIVPDVLDFDGNIDGELFDKQPSYQLWHLLYSAEDDIKSTEEDRLIYGSSDVALKKKLHEKFGFKPAYAKMLANVSLSDDYGSLSARAIRKILPYMQTGNDYYDACRMAGYNHSNSFTKEELENRILKDNLEILPKNSLRNPVVEKILNQMVNLVNQLIEEYGKPDEVRIELARELKKSAKEREDATQYIASATRANEEIRKIIQKDFGFAATKNDVVRFKLWKELDKNGNHTLFTNQYISREKIFSKDIDIEHIIPKAVLFDDSFSNKTLAFRSVNLKKADRTAIDFITQDYFSELDKYKARVEHLYKEGAIQKGKYKKLLMSLGNLPDGFIERDLRNSQYIAKKAKRMLFEVVNNVIATTGSITDKLREDWDLINVMKELNLPKYRALGLTESETRKNGKTIERIIDWTKRNDHRHHAMDALTVAFTTHSHIQYINYLNARRNENHKEHTNIIAIEKKIKGKDNNGKSRYVAPTSDFREKSKKHIENILISFKAKNKVVTKNINKTKRGNEINIKEQLTPRGQLHKETMYGKSLRLMDRPLKINKKLNVDRVNCIANKEIRDLMVDHLMRYGNNPEVAFSTKVLKESPLFIDEKQITEVFCYEEIFTIRKLINPDNFKDLKSLQKVVDEGVKNILVSRLHKYAGDAKKAFSDLEKEPIWLNKEKGIAIKRVTISGVSNAEALHHKKDHTGDDILNSAGQKIPSDYVSTGNNHHVAIYIDEDGKLHDNVVSLYEAVAKVTEGLAVIDKEFNNDQGWQLLFTMKQNEMFVFPSEDFNPKEIDLLDVNNATIISKHLFRVQKFSKVEYGNSAVRDYVFRHHLETQLIDNKILKDTTFIVCKSLPYFNDIVKVRIDHIGKIVQVGEY